MAVLVVFLSPLDRLLAVSSVKQAASFAIHDRFRFSPTYSPYDILYIKDLLTFFFSHKEYYFLCVTK